MKLRAAFGSLAVTGFVTVSALADGTAQGFPSNVTAIKSEKGKTVSASGKLESGAPMADLSWAAKSSVACFPATQNERFRGNHVLFSTEIPPRSKMDIKVTPKDPTKDVSIWAYQIGKTNYSLPPALASAVSCEAEYKWDRPKKGKTQDHTRAVHLEATTNGYNVVIGVSGPKEATAGDFTVDVKLE
jgi:hypothetical protein